jgi:ribosomal protein S16
MDEKSLYCALMQQHIEHYIESHYFKITMNKLRNDIKEGKSIDVIGEFTPYSDNNTLIRAKEDVTLKMDGAEASSLKSAVKVNAKL